MFLLNAWYVAAWATEVTEKPLARTLLGRPVVLYRGVDGEAAVLDDKCPHRGLPLSLGSIEGNDLRCGYHGLLFGPDGSCQEIPGQTNVPAKMCVRSYPVVEQNQLVWFWPGDPGQCDSSLIPSFPYHDEAAWPFISHHQKVACNYQLVVDNLLDQSHIAYVHGKSIGGNAAGHAVAEMKIEPTERGMYFMRWLRDAPPPPVYVQADIGFKETDKLDRWAEFEFVAPASVLQFSGGLPVEQKAPETGKRDGGWALRIMHNITPETETTSHYFWGACHGFKQDDPTVTQWMFESIRDTFLEDEVILEAQQRRITEMPGPLVSTKHDAARVRADQALKRLLKEESDVSEMDLNES